MGKKNKGEGEPFKVVTTTDRDGRRRTTTVTAKEEKALRAAGRPVKVEIDEHGGRVGGW